MASGLVPAIPAQQHRRPAAPVDQQDRLLAARDGLLEQLAQAPREEALPVLAGLGRLPTQVHHLDFGQAAAGHPLGEIEHLHPALRRSASTSREGVAEASITGILQRWPRARARSRA